MVFLPVKCALNAVYVRRQSCCWFWRTPSELFTALTYAVRIVDVNVRRQTCSIWWRKTSDLSMLTYAVSCVGVFFMYVVIIVNIVDVRRQNCSYCWRTSSELLLFFLRKPRSEWFVPLTCLVMIVHVVDVRRQNCSSCLTYAVRVVKVVGVMRQNCSFSWRHCTL